MTPLTAAVGQQSVAQLGVKGGVEDFLEFVDETKGISYAYLYHRAGSRKAASRLLPIVYLEALRRATAWFWFGSLSLRLAIELADRVLAGERVDEEADIESVYLKNILWLKGDERQAVSSLHEVLWSLPAATQRLLTLSLLIGLDVKQVAVVQRWSQSATETRLREAEELLLARWSPPPSLKPKLASLAFLPPVDAAMVDKLRSGLVEKYSAQHLRRYQWLLIGGAAAVLSNVIVAGVIAFVVLTQPPTSLKTERRQLAAVTALALQREERELKVQRTLQDIQREAQRLVSGKLSQDLMPVTFSLSLKALKDQQAKEAAARKVLEVLKRARTAMERSMRSRLALTGVTRGR